MQIITSIMSNLALNIHVTFLIFLFSIQTELQGCLYEYGFKDKWYRLELLTIHSDCIKIYEEVKLL